MTARTNLMWLFMAGGVIVLVVAAVVGIRSAENNDVSSVAQPAALAASVHGPVPPGRMGAAMAYDSTDRLTVMYGGQKAAPTGSTELDDTWVWDGTVWRELDVPGPRLSGPSQLSMTDDPADGGVLLAGPHVCGEPPDCAGPGFATQQTQTWLFRRGSWSHVAAGGVEPEGVLTTIPATGQVIAAAWVSDLMAVQSSPYGILPVLGSTHTPAPIGATPPAEEGVLTFTWQAGMWSPAPTVATAAGTLRLVPTADGASADLVMDSCYPLGAACGESIRAAQRAWRWSGSAWVNDTSAPSVPQGDIVTSAIAGSSALIIGRDRTTWVGSPAGWQREPRITPFYPRLGAAVALDRNGEWVLFGGGNAIDDSATFGSDTWILGAAGWRYGAGAAPLSGYHMSGGGFCLNTPGITRICQPAR